MLRQPRYHRNDHTVTSKTVGVVVLIRQLILIGQSH